jgi:S-adenosylmethionine-diacylglycerol 3-amino-3-carboxypropyl transferase
MEKDMSAQTQYFNKLNYTMANEDTALEAAMVEQLRPASILSVCGSGGRSLPLALAGAKRLVCSDLAKEQLWLAELRESLFRSVSREDFLKFFGYPPFAATTGVERERIFSKLTLSAEAKAFFIELFKEKNWETLLYDGKWERTFSKISDLVRKFTGHAASDLFEFKDLPSQSAFWTEVFPKLRWTGVLLFVGNASFFNALLYKGHFVRKNIPENHFSFYKGAYDRIYKRTLARENFFAQMSFLGGIKYPEGVPFEARPEAFDLIKAGLSQCHVSYACEDINTLLKSGREKFDFVSYSDVPSYFQGETERNFLQDARASLNPGSVVVLRHYLRVPEMMNLEGFVDITAEWSREIALERTQMYIVQVLKFQGDRRS